MKLWQHHPPGCRLQPYITYQIEARAEKCVEINLGTNVGVMVAFGDELVLKWELNWYFKILSKQLTKRKKKNFFPDAIVICICKIKLNCFSNNLQITSIFSFNQCQYQSACISSINHVLLLLFLFTHITQFYLFLFACF